MIPYGRQDITAEDIARVGEILNSDFLTQGPAVPAFEKAMTEQCGTRHAMAVNSATSALHLACRALGVGAGDVVWTSPITFVATANVARMCGAEVDFVDIDPDTANMSVPALAEKLSRTAKMGGRLPKVVMPVHFGGQSCDMAALATLAQEYEFAVIEDASHAVGGRYRDRPVGACAYSDITVFSFHPVKIITTGEGGMALTNRDDLAEKMTLLRSHGVTRDPAQMTGKSDGPWYYEQVDLGYNYRMTDVQAALGLSQLARLEDYVRRRHVLAARYDVAFRDLPLAPLRQDSDVYSAYHLYVVRLDLDQIGKSRRAVFERLKERGIGVNVHYIPVHTQPYYRALGFEQGDFPLAEAYYARAITLPLYPALTEEAQDKVIRSVKDAIS
ncbi:UDP-4-amino-4,6-dideoxy-N-acetyl-beta-L-altrosamine transaminase [Luteithermobacter gelatinilyticus]|uniref:UDP-4-amino-4, 6-dideoxy-N-acetyl-beta-L-altrosamine transaminase n=1 Tax=Luteithermobacter gelatinilyticus TaxID=2582913 RepID=UPI0011066480